MQGFINFVKNTAMTYDFCLRYGLPPRFNSCTYFAVDLSDSDASFLRGWLKGNSECDLCYLEDDNLRLFNLINDACNEAFFEDYNNRRIENGDKPAEDYTEVEWPFVTIFEWDERLIQPD